MSQAFSSDIFRVATAYEASKETRTVSPDAAEAAKSLGRARFYDALAGRYGLPGSIFDASDNAPSGLAAAGNPVSDYFNLRAMTVAHTQGLADRLSGAGRLDRQDGDLLGYRLDSLPYAGDSVFSTSPVAQFVRQLSSARGENRTTDLIAQQEEQLRYLTQNEADPKAVRGARNVLAQLRQLQIEQNLYAQFDSSRDYRDRNRSGTGPFGAAIDMISLPPSAISLFSRN